MAGAAVKLLVASAVAAAPLAAAAAAFGAALFATPKRAVYCTLSVAQPTYLLCWRPGDGYTATVGRTGRADGSYVSANYGRRDGAKRILRYGQRWRAYGWTCVSRTNGLTCTNTTRHGFWIGRMHRSRLF
jgi:hypothetical protein